MRIGLAIGAVLLAGAGAAPAQQVSDLQLCIWQCLAGAGEGDPTNPAYDACVETNCSDQSGELEPQNPAPAALPEAGSQGTMSGDGAAMSGGTDMAGQGETPPEGGAAAAPVGPIENTPFGRLAPMQRWASARTPASQPPGFDGYTGYFVNRRGVRLGYHCRPGLDSARITIWGGPVPAEAGLYEIRVEGINSWEPDFRLEDGVLVTNVRPFGTIPAALRSGELVELFTLEGRRLGGFRLTGSAAAIGAATRYCFGR